MNAATKYVVSRSLEDADAWQNSILLRGDAVDTVAQLKGQTGRDLAIIGSASELDRCTTCARPPMSFTSSHSRSPDAHRNSPSVSPSVASSTRETTGPLYFATRLTTGDGGYSAFVRRFDHSPHSASAAAIFIGWVCTMCCAWA